MSATLMTAVASVSGRTNFVVMPSTRISDIVASLFPCTMVTTPAGRFLGLTRVPLKNEVYCSYTTILAAGTPAAITPATIGKMSSLLVAIVPPVWPAMPFILIATLSSLCTKRANALARSVSPVNSVIARSSIIRAASSLGKSPFGMRTSDLETLMILPGAAMGTKPAGGDAARLAPPAACARELTRSSAPAHAPATAAAVPKKRRRETVGSTRLADMNHLTAQRKIPRQISGLTHRERGGKLGRSRKAATRLGRASFPGGPPGPRLSSRRCNRAQWFSVFGCSRTYPRAHAPCAQWIEARLRSARDPPLEKERSPETRPPSHRKGSNVNVLARTPGALLVASLVGASVLTLSGCGSGDDSPPETKKDVEIFSWWTAGGEKEALDALIAYHQKAHPDENIINAAQQGSATAEQLLETDIAQKRYPDTFQINAG